MGAGNIIHGVITSFFNFLTFVRNIDSLKFGYIFCWNEIKIFVSASTIDRVFWAFYPAIKGFKHCIHVICVDGVSMIGRNGATLIIALSLEGSNYIWQKMKIVEAFI